MEFQEAADIACWQCCYYCGGFLYIQGAFLLCVAAWLVAGRDPVTSIGKVEPKYVLLGGVIGAGITWTVIKSMEALGPAKAVLLIVISQLIVAYVIELLGLFGVDKEPLEIRKIIGMVIALIGVAIFQWK